MIENKLFVADKLTKVTPSKHINTDSSDKRIMFHNQMKTAICYLLMKPQFDWKCLSQIIKAKILIVVLVFSNTNLKLAPSGLKMVN